jgi:hypothetical protein
MFKEFPEGKMPRKFLLIQAVGQKINTMVRDASHYTGGRNTK